MIHDKGYMTNVHINIYIYRMKDIIWHLCTNPADAAMWLGNMPSVCRLPCFSIQFVGCQLPIAPYAPGRTPPRA